MTKTKLQKQLFHLQDTKYRDFQSKLIPNINPDTIIGVRTPDLKKLAKKLEKEEDVKVFLRQLPHTYFEENQMHAFIISDMKDYEECLNEVVLFLPYVDNWATCDQMSPKVFGKHKEELLKMIKEWISSKKTYTIRFGVGMLMKYYLDDDFKPEYLKWVSKIKSDEYYVNMMLAWFFATALAKQYDATLPYLEKHKLDPWVHNKTIQKAIESYRITSKQKEYLRKLKV